MDEWEQLEGARKMENPGCNEYVLDCTILLAGKPQFTSCSVISCWEMAAATYQGWMNWTRLKTGCIAYRFRLWEAGDLLFKLEHNERILLKNDLLAAFRQGNSNNI